jgi:hypothetical protein
MTASCHCIKRRPYAGTLPVAALPLTVQTLGMGETRTKSE